jgi:hypothetical protein
MYAIAQSQMLLRTRTELPNDLRLATEEFLDDWIFVKSANALQMAKQITMCGWSFIGVADGSQRSGVGDTSSEAIGNALRLALRHTNPHSNAAEVEHIELTQYPWFFLARVNVRPYYIQQGAVLPVIEGTKAIPAIRQRKSPAIDAGVFYQHFGSAMPRLKKMLILSQDSQN